MVSNLGQATTDYSLLGDGRAYYNFLKKKVTKNRLLPPSIGGRVLAGGPLGQPFAGGVPLAPYQGVVWYADGCHW